MDTPLPWMVALLVAGLLLASASLVILMVGWRQRLPVAVILLSVGVGVAVGSGRWCDAAEQAAGEEDLAYLSEIAWRPQLAEADEAAATDAGRRVVLLEPAVPRPRPDILAAEARALAGIGWGAGATPAGPATDASNCHGWVFTGGRYWVMPADVDRILDENGYEPVSDPRPGDLLVYRNENDEIVHTAVVREAGPVVVVEGKWGWMGVYRHAIRRSCYGPNWTFYRSPREGHLLAGLPADDTAPSATLLARE